MLSCIALCINSLFASNRTTANRSQRSIECKNSRQRSGHVHFMKTTETTQLATRLTNHEALNMKYTPIYAAPAITQNKTVSHLQISHQFLLFLNNLNIGSDDCFVS